MKPYLITYDNMPPADYDNLYRLMASWQAVRLAESVWLATLNGPADVIRNIVAQNMQAGDRIAVIHVPRGVDWATAHASAAANAWLSDNVLPAQYAA